MKLSGIDCPTTCFHRGAVIWNVLACQTWARDQKVNIINAGIGA
jgi:hypothetical protein